MNLTNLHTWIVGLEPDDDVAPHRYNDSVLQGRVDLVQAWDSVWVCPPGGVGPGAIRVVPTGTGDVIIQTLVSGHRCTMLLVIIQNNIIDEIIRPQEFRHNFVDFLNFYIRNYIIKMEHNLFFIKFIAINSY